MPMEAAGTGPGMVSTRAPSGLDGIGSVCCGGGLGLLSTLLHYQQFTRPITLPAGPMHPLAAFRR